MLQSPLLQLVADSSIVTNGEDILAQIKGLLYHLILVRLTGVQNLHRSRLFATIR